MKATTWLAIIFLGTLALEGAWWLLVGFSFAAGVRVLLTVTLFALLLRGTRFVRHVIGVLYLAGGLLATLLAVRLHEAAGVALACVVFAVASFAASGFFFRSGLLKGLAAQGRRPRGQDGFAT